MSNFGLNPCIKLRNTPIAVVFYATYTLKQSKVDKKKIRM